jgi:hypothetical protein
VVVPTAGGPGDAATPPQLETPRLSAALSGLTHLHDSPLFRGLDRLLNHEPPPLPVELPEFRWMWCLVLCDQVEDEQSGHVTVALSTRALAAACRPELQRKHACCVQMK